MAVSKYTDLKREKAALIRQLDRSREEGGDALDSLAAALDVPMQLGRSFQAGSWKWLAGALAVGTVVGLAMFPKKRPSKRLGVQAAAKSGKRALTLSILGALAQAAIALAKPALTKLAKDQIEKWVKGLHQP